MNAKTTALVVAFAVITFNTMSVVHAVDKPAPVPLGHPDFYPSAERPIGWRGDGTGAWPGANGVTFWNAETGEGIVWKTKMPGAGFAQPLVAGEKVFTTADPNLLLCLDVHTGEILWQTAIDHTTVMPSEIREKARAEMAFFDENWLKYCRWRAEVETLAIALRKQGQNPEKLLCDAKKDGARALLPPADGAAIDDQTRKLWMRLIEEQKVDQWAYGGGWGNEVLDQQSPLYQRMLDANRLYDIWYGGRYDGLTALSFATPCTDGERVYVTTANNAVAAVNYDGTIAWLIWESRATDPKEYGGGIGRKDGPLGTRHVPSPLLHGDYLVVHQNNEMRAYDKRTGKKVWGDVNTIERLKIGVQGPARQWPEGTTPCVVVAPLPGGSSLPLVFDGTYFLYRLEDGKVLSTNGWYGACSSPVALGNAIMKNNESSFLARVTAENRDTVRLETLFESRHGDKNPGTPTFKEAATSIVCGDWWYAGVSKGVVRMSLLDGHTESLGGRLFGGYSSPILVGNRIYQFEAGNAFKMRSITPHEDRDGVVACGIFNLESKMVAPVEKALIDLRILEDSPFGLRNLPSRMSWCISTSSPSAQANRLFFRTKGWLYCVGDPGDPFPSPKDCPVAGRSPTPPFAAPLKEIAVMDDTQKLAPYLNHEHPAVRAAALRKLVGFKGAPQNGNLSPLIRRLAVEDRSTAVRAVALLALGVKPGEPGGVILREQILAAGQAGPWQHSKPPLLQVQQVLRVLGSAADATIVAELKDGSKESREAIAAAICDGSVTLRDAIRDELVPLLSDRKIDTELVRRALASLANDPAVSTTAKEPAEKKGKQ